ncbi:MAG: NUDIX hydrolase [Deltaproteobacteria bacterium]|nr:NUDIX hydrolase [Deltaproteobacteria bacterium]
MHRKYDFKYCPVCGEKMEQATLKENEPARLVCTGCAFVFYLDPKVVACSVVEMNGKIVILKRALNPQRGKWVLPGGYVDRGEEVQTAAVRETLEECGVRTRIKDLLGVYSYPGKTEVLVAYVAAYLSGKLSADDETLDVRLVGPEEIPWEHLAFQSTVDILREYCTRVKK